VYQDDWILRRIEMLGAARRRRGCGRADRGASRLAGGARRTRWRVICYTPCRRARGAR